MAMTETRPAAASAEDAAPAPAAPVEPAGLAGWLTTSDHKRVGRMWIATSLAFLLVGGVLGELLGAERLDSGADLLKDGTFPQIYTLHAEAAVLLFLVPFFIGLATYLVPLQVGSPEIAFPRGSATAYWGYLVSGLLLCASYVADGGITGTTSTAVDLYLLSLILVAGSLAIGALSAVTTVLTMRAPGLTLLRTPMLSWSVLVGGGLLLIQLPVLVARLIGIFLEHHLAGALPDGAYDGIAWFWSQPTVYLAGVFAAGVLLDVVPTLAARPLRFPVAGISVIGLLGILSIGGWVLDPAATDDLLYVGMGLAAVLPALALLGVLGDTARAGSPRLVAPLVLSLGSALLLLAGAAAGAVGVIEPLELAGTTWDAGQQHLVLMGAGGLAAFAALWFWAPKLWGAALSDKAGYLVALLVLGGTVLLAGPDLFNGASEDLPRGAIEFDATDTTKALNGVSAAGGALAALGAIVAIGAVVAAGRRRGTADADPWGGGASFEWTTSSPPPAHNFDETPEVTA
ncbi:MAG TPA: cbb3-type cytochrome c oxidase subunit I [Acidimicrobiales bacterium]|nr:cbb3-type cytochrome c oxidase subunit I [Acidimicrobiales bacterium]